MKIDKRLSVAPLPSPGALPKDPAGDFAPRHPFRLALCAFAMVRPHLWQILDPPLRSNCAVLNESCMAF